MGILRRACPDDGAFAFFLYAGRAGALHDPSASKLYKQGQKAEARDDIEAAYEFYYQAYQKKPENIEYKAA